MRHKITRKCHDDRRIAHLLLPVGSSLNPEEVCLLQQPFIKDPAVTIQDLVSGVIAKTGENIRVGRFTRFALGQE